MSDLFGCLCRPPTTEPAPPGTLAAIAREFSPRYEGHGEGRITMDLRGLERLFGGPQAVAAELAREARVRAVRVHIGVASTCTTAQLVALARPGITVVPRGAEAATLAPLPLDLLEHVAAVSSLLPSGTTHSAPSVSVFRRWGLKTLGDLAALPADEFTARVGRRGSLWQALARGDDLRPLVPDVPEERFEGSLDLEWPIEGIEPLSFVLTRLLEPLSIRLARRDRGAAVLHVLLRLVTAAGAPRDVHVRRLALPSPIRDARVLRTLALLDIESHPPPGAVEAVSVTIEPTPGRVLQHTLFTRALPAPDVLATLLARLGAVMGQDRVGAPVAVDAHRPDAFAMSPFATEHQARPKPEARSPKPVSSALRRCRPPVPAQVTWREGVPNRLTTTRQGYATGPIVRCAGPWRTSGEWWTDGAGRAGTDRAGRAGRAGGAGGGWNRDEWDVAMRDGTVYRIFRDADTGGWFIDAWID